MDKVLGDSVKMGWQNQASEVNLYKACAWPWNFYVNFV
jgi:hypothetical protein